jgi:hypothetical protein
VQQNSNFYDYQQPFNTANKYSLSLLNDQTRNNILLQIFPLRMRIYLVAELNILSIEFENKQFKTDDILSEVDLGDVGK